MSYFKKLSIMNSNTLKMYSKIKLNLVYSQLLKKYRIFDLLKIVQNFYTMKNFFELKKKILNAKRYHANLNNTIKKMIYKH